MSSAENLIRIRKKSMLSQKGAAKHSGLATVAPSTLEAAKSNGLRMSTARRFANAFGCSRDALLSGEAGLGQGGGHT